MAPMRLTALLLSSCLLAAAPSWASTNKKSACAPATTYAYFNLTAYSSAEHPDPCVWVIEPGIPYYIGVELYAAEVSKVRFSLPEPPLGAAWGVNWNFPAIGDMTTGIELDLGCTSGGTVVLGQFFVFLDPAVAFSCVTWQINDAEAFDCNGNPQPTEAPTFAFKSAAAPYCWSCWQYCQRLVPHGLQPEQGATGVPVDAPLSWSDPIFEYPGDPLGYPCFINIGTDPECGDMQQVLVPCDVGSIVLDFLEHSTTYYWRAGYVMTGDVCHVSNLSPVHWFTTAGPIATEHTTWGHVKAMYRD